MLVRILLLGNAGAKNLPRVSAIFMIGARSVSNRMMDARADVRVQEVIASRSRIQLPLLESPCIGAHATLLVRSTRLLNRLQALVVV